jgi:hypothetical protein
VVTPGGMTSNKSLKNIWKEKKYCYDTCWKVVGLSPNEVTDYFQLPNPSSCIMALGFTQPLTEISTRKRKQMFLGSKAWLATIPPYVSQLFRQCGILNISQPYRPPCPVRGIVLLLIFVPSISRQIRCLECWQWSECYQRMSDIRWKSWRYWS